MPLCFVISNVTAPSNPPGCQRKRPMELSAIHVPSELVSALKITPFVATRFCGGGYIRHIDGERERERKGKSGKNRLQAQD